MRRKSMKSPEKDVQQVQQSLEQRRDSCRINDISEASTTEDYATAHDNSGDDTVSCRQPADKAGSKEGSSFESASSLPGNSKEEASFQVVPSSTSPIHEEAEVRRVVEEETASVESSSSGSYSLDSCQKDALEEGKARAKSREWTEQERTWAKKGFTLDLSDVSGEPEGEEEDEKMTTSDGQSNLPTSPKKAKTKTSGIRKTQQVNFFKF